MRSFLSTLRVHRQSLAFTLLVSYLAGCTSWKVGTPTPAAYLEREHPQTVRITRTDGSRIVLTQTRLEHDTIFGLAGGGLQAEDSARHQSIPLNEIRLVEVRHSSAAAGLGVLGGTLLVLTIVACATENSAFSPC